MWCQLATVSGLFSQIVTFKMDQNFRIFKAFHKFIMLKKNCEIRWGLLFAKPSLTNELFFYLQYVFLDVFYRNEKLLALLTM